MQTLKHQISTSVVEVDSVDDHRDTPSKCIRAVNAAVSSFTISMGQASTPNDQAPWDILRGTLQRISGVFELKTSDLDLSSSETLHRILQATFDTDTQAFLTEDSSTVFDHLSPTQKARIHAQAIAAITTIFQRLVDTGRTVTQGLLNREAQLFAESDHRTLMLDVIEHSRLFEQCYLQSQISDMVLKAINSSPDSTNMDDSTSVMISSAAICERPENMGLPFGFTIMALN